MSQPPFRIRKIPRLAALSIHGASWPQSPSYSSSSLSIEDQDAKLIRPTIHYIFSDDDPDFSPALHQDTAQTTVVIVDFDDSGSNALSVCSLAGNLQALSCSITSASSTASSWTGGDNTADAKDDLMLTVHMASAIPAQSSSSSKVATTNNNLISSTAHLDQLVLAFNERNKQIRQVVSYVEQAEPNDEESNDK